MFLSFFAQLLFFSFLWFPSFLPSFLPSYFQMPLSLYSFIITFSAEICKYMLSLLLFFPFFITLYVMFSFLSDLNILACPWVIANCWAKWHQITWLWYYSFPILWNSLSIPILYIWFRCYYHFYSCLHALNLYIIKINLNIVFTLIILDIDYESCFPRHCQFLG